MIRIRWRTATLLFLVVCFALVGAYREVMHNNTNKMPPELQTLRILGNNLRESGEYDRLRFAKCTTEDGDKDDRKNGVKFFRTCEIRDPAKSDVIYFSVAFGWANNIVYFDEERAEDG
jgi:hypothetical protein